MSSAQTTYAARKDATPEGELNTLAAVYRILLESSANRNAIGVPSTDGDDAMKGSKHDRAFPGYT